VLITATRDRAEAVEAGHKLPMGPVLWHGSPHRQIDLATDVQRIPIGGQSALAHTQGELAVPINGAIRCWASWTCKAIRRL